MSQLTESVQPHLDPGEKIAYVFAGQTGIKPSTWNRTSYLILLTNRGCIVAVTDRRIAVFQGGRFRGGRFKPKSLLASLPTGTRLEHGSGRWSRVRVGDLGVWMSKSLYSLLDKANASAADRAKQAPAGSGSDTLTGGAS